MARWEPNARGRLAEAALALFAERGFENTTVAAIAERAGLTERTFFRHFADKREVLFGGGEELQDAIVEAVAGAPGPAPAMDVVAAGIEAAARVLQERREFARRRQAVIAGNAELRERELIKLASLAALIAHSMRERGIEDPAASLTAEAGIAVFRIAFERWIADDNEQDFPTLIRESLDQLRVLTAA
jgi:AcrR family transcriptional regulator